jgi:hypothetical protein
MKVPIDDPEDTIAPTTPADIAAVCNAMEEDLFMK